jgi:hypothetical protein
MTIRFETSMAPKAKSDSLWNWFGRQIGHVKKAVTTDVTKPSPAPLPPPPPPQQQTTPPPPPEQSKVIYRDEKAEEVDLPDRPGVKLRRTVIDEVIVEQEKSEARSQKSEEGN